MNEIPNPKQGIRTVFPQADLPAAGNFNVRISSLFRNSDFVLRVYPRLCRELFYALPLALMFLLALTPGISFTEDLGRHLLLGKIILETGRVPDTNLLTYTCPDFPFINHHWLSEVVFYLLHSAVGLNGLILFKALLMCATLALAMRSAPIRRISPLFGLAAALSAVALGYRVHIRPELFTYFGVAFYGCLIVREFSVSRHKNFDIAAVGSDRGRSGFNAAGCGRRKINPCWILLIAYGWFWANAHIYFIFGIGMIFCYWLACWWKTRQDRRGERTRGRKDAAAAAIGLFALIAVSLVNPNGWRGLIYPLAIFSNYGIGITENASPLSCWQTVLDPMLLALPLLSALALWVFRRVVMQWRDLTAGQLAISLILFVALIAAWRMVRNVPLLTLTLLPALACILRRETVSGHPESRLSGYREEGSKLNLSIRQRFFATLGMTENTSRLRSVGTVLVIALNLWLAFTVVDGSYSRIFPSPIGPTPFGFDDESRYLALRRLCREGLPTKIFSDYNSGSLVEYNIYPERGYVDNRPEAFPENFWKNEYEPALALGAAWEKTIAQRDIQTIAVSIAGVKENFIRALLAAPSWRLVHLDFFFAVFVRNTPENSVFIRRHFFGQAEMLRFVQETARRIRTLSSTSVWKRQVLADQIVYELYGIICLGRNDLAWPLVWEMHLRYPDYQLVHELMRVSAPLHAWPAVVEVMAGKAYWPLAVKQILDYGSALETQGRVDEARAAYRRGKFIFPLSSKLPPDCIELQGLERSERAVQSSVPH